MATTLKKANFFIEADVRKEMEALVPAGSRAKVINEALRKELLRIKREQVTEKLMKLKSRSTAVAPREIVQLLKKDRKRA